MAMEYREPTERKSFPFVALKVEEDEGIVEHLISVFGVEDRVKDIVHPGSFTKTLQERAGQFKVLDAHRRSSIEDILGRPLEIAEVPREELPPKLLDRFPEAMGGLKARTQFLMQTRTGKEAFERVKAGVVEWSFGYDVMDSDYSTKDDGSTVRNLRTLRLWEYSPLPFGANPAAVTISAKGASGGEEDKPAPDVTENTIRMRVRDPGGFQEGSFRTITISKDQGIKAVIGRLKGKTSTTVQSYIFDKSKWTVERAKKWVAEHRKAFVIVVAPEDPEPDEQKGAGEDSDATLSLKRKLLLAEVELLTLQLLAVVSGE